MAIKINVVRTFADLNAGDYFVIEDIPTQVCLCVMNGHEKSYVVIGDASGHTACDNWLFTLSEHTPVRVIAVDIEHEFTSETVAPRWVKRGYTANGLMMIHYRTFADDEYGIDLTTFNVVELPSNDVQVGKLTFHVTM